MINGKEIKVSRGVYPPSDDTFLLIDALGPAKAGRALELCCGTGVVGLCAADGIEEITALDINPEAARNTIQNYDDNGLGDKLGVIVGDLFTPLRKQEFDLVFMNPPYLPDDEGMPEDQAWSGMKRGRAIIDRFIYGLGGYLGPEGRALFLQSTVNGIDASLELIREQGMIGRVAAEKRFQFEGLVVIEVRYATIAANGITDLQKD